jgi:penicillin-binding protein 1A
MSIRYRKIFRWTLYGIGILCLLPLLFFVLVHQGAFGKLHTGEELRNIRSYQGSEVYSSDKKLLGSFFWENRSSAKPEDIPPFLIHALIATEDARFYEHRGVDFRSLMRVFFKTLLMRDKSAGGGSTISQQLAKNLFKRQDHGILSMPVNKIKEAVHAVRFSQVYTQEEILMLYLNTVSMGEDTYGIKNASLRFFGKEPKALALEQAAMLVGMLKSPTQYNPRLHPDKALIRRNVVIHNLAAHRYINAAEADSLQKLPLRLNYKNAGLYGDIAPYFLRHVEEQAKTLLDSLKAGGGHKYNLYTDGLKIHATLDYRMQEQAMEAVKKHMKSLQAQFDRQWTLNMQNKMLIRKAILNTPYYKKLLKQGLTRKEIARRINEKKSREVFDWDGGHRASFSFADSVIHSLKQLHTGFLAMEPGSGYIRAWVGGNDYRFFQYDHVKSKRQVGSTFKPVVYATALDRGMDPCDYIENDRRVYPQFEGWSPGNADGVYGGKYSLKGALAGSVNVVTAEVLLKAGIGNTIATARRMGIESRLPAVPSIALGVADISLLEMVKTYCVFPNGGKTTRPVVITHIEDARGRVIYKAPAYKSRQAIGRQSAWYVTQMLQAVVNEGTAQRLRTRYALKGDMAGKTGTTQSGADGWFIGYTPGLVSGVWVGAENPAVHFRSSEYGQGAHMALPVWAFFMQQVRRDRLTRRYSTGHFAGKGLKDIPPCASFREDTFLDRVKELFSKKDRQERKPRPVKEKKKRSWFWQK